MEDSKDQTYQLAHQMYNDEKERDCRVCEEEGCTQPAIQCEIPGGYDHETKSHYPVTYEYYCSEHAAENGYCCCCGTFIAGWRDFSNYCENCEDQIRTDTDDWDDEVSGGYDFFDDPYYP